MRTGRELQQTQTAGGVAAAGEFDEARTAALLEAPQTAPFVTQLAVALHMQAHGVAEQGQRLLEVGDAEGDGAHGGSVMHGCAYLLRIIQANCGRAFR